MAASSDQTLKKWEYPKKSGIWIRPFVYEKTFNGKTEAYSAFMVTVPAKITGASRKRKQFQYKSEAELFASKEYSGSKKQGEQYFKATDAEREEFAVNIPKLREYGISLTEAVDYALKRLKPKGGEKTISEISSELIESKRVRYERGDLRERSFRDFSHRADKFAQAFEDTPSYDLTVEDLKDWLIGLDVSTRTTQNYLSVVSEILKYACQKKYIPFSTVDDLTDSDRKELCGSNLESKEPEILTVEQSNKLLEAAKAHPELDLLGAVVLGLFCGIRVEELKRLDWSQIKDDEDEPVVTISSSIAKKRRIRHVPIPPNALKWLSICNRSSWTVTRSEHYNDYQKRFRKLLKLAGFGETDGDGTWRSNWGANAMRHSFGTYHFALHGNSIETARLLGHKANDQVLFDHYRALASKQQAKSYFSIVPKKSRSKVVNF